MIFRNFKRLENINKNLTIRLYSVRVRFAPSPTGFLHLGGLRTALYNYLFAKRNKGKFILRIEDTDQSRIVEGATKQIQKDLLWAGIQIDEGPNNVGEYGPYMQSDRLEIYRKHTKILLNNGSAYHCFCTDKRLDLLRKEALRAREIPKYDNKCRDLSQQEVESRLAKGEPSCIRFKLTPGYESFDDLVFGKITYDVVKNEGDPVIIKSDGFPTYHFANVVDDHCMEISHVLRGVEWQISTTKHILLYRAFNWEPPKFAHLPLLLNSDGSKLSKRQGDIKISHYRETGIFPLALINFIVHSGGGFDKDLQPHLKPKCYILDELSQQFEISRVNSHSGKLSDRLLEFNQLELKRRLQTETEENQLIKEIQQMLQNKYPENFLDKSLQISSEYIRNILRWSIHRINKISDLVSKNLIFIWIVPTSYDIKKEDAEKIELFVDSFGKLEDSSVKRDELNGFMKKFCENNKIDYRNFMKTLRALLSGLKEGPSVAEMLEILGKNDSIRRLKLSLNKK